MPGADAVSAELELLEPDPGLELEPELELDEQAATVNAATVATAAACQRRRYAFLIRFATFRPRPLLPGGNAASPP